MKMILSRKGFDSEYGGCASPIFEDGSMVSFPIPFAGASHRMADATRGNVHFAGSDVLSDLTRRRAVANRRDAQLPVHLDPYLTREKLSAPLGWRPAFGQDGSAQGHLREKEVGAGDLFLFFGWFRKVEMFKGRWRYVPRSPDLHVLFGWLQVETMLAIDAGFTVSQDYLWLADHPHLQHRALMGHQNSIYVASDRLALDGVAGVTGGGAFNTFRPCLQLTSPAGALGRSEWRLPAWFHPSSDGTPSLSHHGKRDRWHRAPVDPAWTRLRSVAKGQEFVIDLEGDHNLPAMNWLRSLFSARSLES